MIEDAPKRFIVSKAKVRKIVDPWTCGTCKREFLEKAEIYMTFDGKNFCCSKCFRLYERAKHAKDLKK
jgi:hypothetical protein